MDSDSSSVDTLSTETDFRDDDLVSQSQVTVVDSRTSVSSQTRSEFQPRTSPVIESSSRKQNAHGLSHASSLPSSLKYSRHFASYSGADDSDSDTFDSVESLSNFEDEIVSESKSASSSSNSAVSQEREANDKVNNNSVVNNYNGSTFKTNSYHKSSRLKIDDAFLNHSNSIFLEENDGKDSLTSRSNSYSGDDTETVSQDFSEENLAGEQSSAVPSLSLSFSSVWECSPSEHSTSPHSLEDKFTSADGEIVYYSDFSADALTARQYTYRSEDNSELSYRAKSNKRESGLQEFLKKRIQLLKQRDTFENGLSEAPIENKIAAKMPESDDLKRFCSMKLNQLKNSVEADFGSVEHNDYHERSNCFNRLKKNSDVITFGISETAVQRLLDDRLSMIDFHKLRSCSRCRNEIGHLGLTEFLHSKTAIAREHLVNLQLHSARNSSQFGMTIVGEILAEASHLNQNPELVMQRLLKPLLNKEIHANRNMTD